jgi:hypothetical protein
VCRNRGVQAARESSLKRLRHFRNNLIHVPHAHLRCQVGEPVEGNLAGADLGLGDEPHELLLHVRSLLVPHLNRGVVEFSLDGLCHCCALSKLWSHALASVDAIYP